MAKKKKIIFTGLHQTPSRNCLAVFAQCCASSVLLQKLCSCIDTAVLIQLYNCWAAFSLRMSNSAHGRRELPSVSIHLHRQVHSLSVSCKNASKEAHGDSWSDSYSDGLVFRRAIWVILNPWILGNSWTTQSLEDWLLWKWFQSRIG